MSAYARAWTMFGDPAYRLAADRIYGFLKDTLAAPGGGFFASYGMSEGEPGVDRRLYARETAQAISGLLAYYDATGVVEARDLAVRAARWALDNRALPGGGFRHAEQDKGGPYLADNVEMAKALLALHRSTGEREWLTRAQATADFIAKTFIDPATGGFFASASPDAKQLTKPIKQREDNVTAVRMFALLSAYTGDVRYREIAEAGMGYLASPPVLDAFGFLPDVLLAEDELRNEPVHVTIVGAKDDPRAAALYRAALAYPLVNKRAEWWDKREGKLANPDVDYPDFPDGPAAFACTSNFCSYPVTAPRRDRRAARQSEARAEAVAFPCSKSSFSPAQSGCTQAKLPPQYCSTLIRSMFAEWGLIQANTRRGVFRVSNLTVKARLAPR